MNCIARMPCQLPDIDDETSLPSFSVWTSNQQNSNILRGILVPDDDVQDTNMTTETLSLCCLDSISPAVKRKIKETEQGNDGHLPKIQRVWHVDSSLTNEDESDSDEDEMISQQMGWSEESTSDSLQSYDSSSSGSDDELLLDEEFSAALSFITKPEEKCHLLRISMLKMKKVVDPEAYLCRSVLINNTMKKLTSDLEIFEHSHTMVPITLFEETITHRNDMTNTFEYEHQASVSQISSASTLQDVYMDFCDASESIDASNSGLHTAFISVASNEVVSTSEEIIASPFSNSINTAGHTYEESSLENQLSVSSQHISSSQACNLQYRSIMQTENSHSETDKASNINVAVFHGILASLQA